MLVHKLRVADLVDAPSVDEAIDMVLSTLAVWYYSRKVFSTT